MIQRIQSLYLLLGAAFLVVFAALAGAWAEAVGAIYAWYPPVVLAAAGLAAAVGFAAMIFYKDRKRQRTVILVAQVLSLVVVALAATGLFLVRAEAAPSRYLIALLPVVGYVLFRLAQRGVDKDIALLKSVDRLR